jgi:hypothetical protein
MATKKIPKSAKTGEDVTLKFAKTHKATTFIQTVPIRKMAAKNK